MRGRVEETKIEPKTSYSNTMLFYQLSQKFKILGPYVKVSVRIMVKEYYNYG